jgi:hypothetical protein
MKSALVILGIVACLALVAASVLCAFSLLALVLSTPPGSAILLAWWSLSLLMILGSRLGSVGASLGLSLPVMTIAPILIIVMVLRLVVYYA